MSNTTQVATTIKGTQEVFKKEGTIAKFQQMLGPQKTAGFISAVLQIVSNNSLLAKAETNSIVQAAAMAASLDLSINPNLGHAYIVPYAGKAQFQIGWKGFVQLAQRSGQFKSLNTIAVYKDQLVSQNPLTGEFEFDFSVVPQGDAIGYAAHFRLTNGFEKIMYMSRKEVTDHATKFSQSFRSNSGVWKDNFDAMAMKTVTKLMLNKYAPLSPQMQTAVHADQAVITEDAEYDYVDNKSEVISVS